MTILRVQASIERDTGLPEDRTTNTLYFSTVTNPADGQDVEDILNAVEDFYQALAPVALSSVNANVVTLKVYDMADPMPRVPIATRAPAIAPNVGGAYPEEVAVTISFAGPQIAGVPQARRRGRIFVGPVSAGLGETVGGRTRVYEGGRVAIAGCANQLLVASLAAAAWSWVVYSPTTAAEEGGVPDDHVVPVTGGWVDDAFDTIRSRGPKASTRTTFAGV